MSALHHQTYGARGGFPVLLHHGLVGSSHVGSDWDAAARRADVELIAVARPGYGRSAPVEMAAIADWPALVAPVLKSQERYGVWGVSAGAPYACALAAVDHRVTAVAITSGLGHVADERVRQLYSNRSQQAFLFFRNGAADDVCRYWYQTLTAALIDEPDDPGLRDSLAHNGAGPGREAVLQQRPWGFSFSEIAVPARLWHTRHDTMVPFATAQHLADSIPGATLVEQYDSEHVPSLSTVSAALDFLAQSGR
ncbi:MAG: alpha/beta fold hydrolase [Mycobacterium sp.]